MIDPEHPSTLADSPSSNAVPKRASSTNAHSKQEETTRSSAERAHLIGVCGTGMGALAGLLVEAGFEVTGSDRAFYPPMSTYLTALGVTTMEGFSPDNLEDFSPDNLRTSENASAGRRSDASLGRTTLKKPSLVVVGNVCRPSNPEAQAAHALAASDPAVAVRSFPAVMRERFLSDRKSVVIAGTHGKTTTTSLTAFLLREAHLRPGYLVGGIPHDFGVPSRLGSLSAPFVLEGDEYDSAFFEKSPKFWQYKPKLVALTSIEHDHLDIYPDEASYLEAFVGLVERIPQDGLLVAYAGDPLVRKVARTAKCPVRYYALEGDDTGDESPIWFGALAPAVGGRMPMDLYGGGTFLGRVHSPLSGAHNARNLLASLALCAEGCGADLATILEAVPRFSGVARRQDLAGIARVRGGDIRVFEDFAHHPTAVATTLKGIRDLNPPGARLAAQSPKQVVGNQQGGDQQSSSGRLIAVFEPKSATASRKLHQARYPKSFDAADVVILAPVGRPEIPESERLDTKALAAAIMHGSPGGATQAMACASLEETLEVTLSEVRAGDVVVFMSNGSFGSLPDRFLAALALRAGNA